MKFEARKYFIREETYFTVGKSEERRAKGEEAELVTRLVRRSGNEGG